MTFTQWLRKMAGAEAGVVDAVQDRLAQRSRTTVGKAGDHEGGRRQPILEELHLRQQTVSR